MEEPELTKDLESNYKAIERAFIKKDLEGVAKFIAPAFVGVTPDGHVMGKDDLLKSLRKQFDTLDVVSWDRRVNKLAVEGDKVRAVAEGLYRTVQDGIPVDIPLVNEDIWQVGPNGWWVVESKGLK